MYDVPEGNLENARIFTFSDAGYRQKTCIVHNPVEKEGYIVGLSFGETKRSIFIL